MSFHAGRVAALLTIAATCCSSAAGVTLTDRQWRRTNKRLVKRYNQAGYGNIAASDPCQAH